jgi:hypothetical protein
VIIVEVLSPSTSSRDAGPKAEDFRLPSVRHYLIVRNENRTVISPRPARTASSSPKIVREGPIILLEPPRDHPGRLLRRSRLMSVMSDRWIRRMAQEHGMIEPFVEAQKREGVISYGLSSYGYDARVADEFKIFTNIDPR